MDHDTRSINYCPECGSEAAVEATLVTDDTLPASGVFGGDGRSACIKVEDAAVRIYQHQPGDEL